MPLIYLYYYRLSTLGPGEIKPGILRELKNETAHILIIRVKKSVNTKSAMPNDLKTAHV